MKCLGCGCRLPNCACPDDCEKCEEKHERILHLKALLRQSEQHWEEEFRNSAAGRYLSNEIRDIAWQKEEEG